MIKKLYLVTIADRYERILELPIDKVEQYAINRAIECGYLPEWRQERAPDDIEYGIKQDFGNGDSAGLVRIQVIHTITSVEDTRYVDWDAPDYCKDRAIIWKELRQRGQGKKYIEPQGTPYTLNQEKDK